MNILRIFSLGFFISIISIFSVSYIFRNPSTNGDSLLPLGIVLNVIVTFFISGLNSVFLSYIQENVNGKIKAAFLGLLPVLVLTGLYFTRDIVSILSFFAIPILLTNLIWLIKTEVNP